MAYRSSTTREPASIGTLPIGTVPSGVAIDDIVIIAGCQDTASGVWTGKLPAGFTLFGSQASPTAPDGQTAIVCWKRATAADTGTYDFTSIIQSAAWICQVYVFSGRHTINPPVAGTVNINQTANPSPVTINANGVTALDGDDLLWISAPDVTIQLAGNGHTAPTNFIKRQDAESTIAGQEWQNLCGCTRDNVSAGATGTVAGSFAVTGADSAGYTSWLIRIPAAPLDVVQGFGLALEIG